jgi:hypothetical protein
MSIARPAALLLISVLFPPCGFAQAPAASGGSARAETPARRDRVPVDSNVAVHLRDGSVVYGRLERLDADSVIVLSTAGRLALARSSVREVRDAGVAHRRGDGSVEYWFPNPHSSRLYFAPTGRTLGQGEGYFADHDIVVGSFAVGATDRITLGGGGFLVPDSRAWFVTSKVGVVRGQDFNLAVGAIVGGWGTSETGGVGYVAGTFGGTDKALTLAVGNGFTGSGLANDQVFMVGGEVRVSRRLSLLSENYLITGQSDAAVSYGVRFLGERTSVDLVFFNLVKNPLFPGFPFLGVAVKW